MTKEGILKHKEVFDAWLSGAKVQYYGEKTKKWIDINNPSWELIIKYRIKPTILGIEDCSFNGIEYKVDKIGKVVEVRIDRIKINNSRTKSTLFKDKKVAEAYAALPLLIRLRDRYNGDWKPNYKDGIDKYYIITCDDEIKLVAFAYTQRILVFETEEIRNRFFKDHRDLIEIAKPLL